MTPKRPLIHLDEDAVTESQRTHYDDALGVWFRCQGIRVGIGGF